MEGMLPEMGQCAIQQHLAGLADAAAQHHCLGIDHTAQVGQEFAQQRIIQIQNLQRHSIACVTGIENILAGQCFHFPQHRGRIGGSQPLACHADNAGSGAILLHTALLAAAATLGFITVDHHVADFAAGAGGTMDQTAIDDDTATYAGAQSHEHHIPAALAAALPKFAQRSHIGIIAGLHREAGEAGQLFCHREHAPAQIDTLIDHTLAIHRAGHANAHAYDLAAVNAVFLQIAGNGRGNIRQDLRTAVGRHRGDLPLGQHRAHFIKIRDLHGGSAQIDTKTIAHIPYLRYVNYSNKWLFTAPQPLQRMSLRGAKRRGNPPKDSFLPLIRGFPRPLRGLGMTANFVNNNLSHYIPNL